MIATRKVPALLVPLALFVFGCRQEQPKAPPTPPIPKTAEPSRSAPVPTATSAPVSAAPATIDAGRRSETIDDATVTARVKAELLKDSDGKLIDIDVASRQGVVQLSGSVPSHGDIDRAIAVAKRVEGVKEVQNKLTLKQS